MKFNAALRIEINAMCWLAWRGSYLADYYLTVYTDGEKCRINESSDGLSIPVSAANGIDKAVMHFAPSDPWLCMHADEIIEFAYEADQKLFRDIRYKVAEEALRDFETLTLEEENGLFRCNLANAIQRNRIYTARLATLLMSSNAEEVMSTIEQAIAETEESWGETEC